MVLAIFYSREIWEKFTAFEASVGELSSVMKVERRRAAALKALVRLLPNAVEWACGCLHVVYVQFYNPTSMRTRLRHKQNNLSLFFCSDK